MWFVRKVGMVLLVTKCCVSIIAIRMAFVIMEPVCVIGCGVERVAISRLVRMGAVDKESVWKDLVFVKRGLYKMIVAKDMFSEAKYSRMAVIDVMKDGQESNAMRNCVLIIVITGVFVITAHATA